MTPRPIHESDRERIRSMGLRVTEPRLEILAAFSRDRAISLEDVRARLQGRTSADTATIYRTVAAFERGGLLHCLRVDGIQRYFLCEHPHAEHAPEESHDDVSVSYCRGCGRIRESHRHHAPVHGDVVSCREERILRTCEDCSAMPG